MQLFFTTSERSDTFKVLHAECTEREATLKAMVWSEILPQRRLLLEA